MKRLTLSIAMIVPLTATPALPAAENDGYVSLFNGKDLSGWTVEGDCEFLVEDGLLWLDGGFGWLRSNETYGDFALHLEWMAEKTDDRRFDSGIFIRTADDGGKPWPKQHYQVNMRHDQVGQVVRAQGAKPAEKFNPPGQWNTYDIVCRGESIAVEINGKPVSTTDGFLEHGRGYIGIQAEVFRFAFRDIRIKRLDSESLFNGKDLTGWTVEGDARFAVRDGLLQLEGGMGWLRSNKTYGDFDLHVEWRAAQRDDGKYDSGIFLRTANDGGTPWPRTRYQINLRQDDIGGVVNAKKSRPADNVHPPGDWNTYDISCRGKAVEVRVNGTLVNTIEKHLYDKSGYIGIQAEKYRFSFRNLRITTK